MRRALWFIAGIVLTAALAFGLYEFDLQRRNAASAYALPAARWTTGEQMLVAQHYPGGQFRASTGDYYVCSVNKSSETVWVVYFANHDLLWTDRGCWRE